MDFGSLRCVRVVGSLIVPDVPLQWGTLIMGEAVHGGGQREYGNSVLSTPLCCESKMTLNNKFYKRDFKFFKNSDKHKLQSLKMYTWVITS